MVRLVWGVPLNLRCPPADSPVRKRGNAGVASGGMPRGNRPGTAVAVVKASSHHPFPLEDDMKSFRFAREIAVPVSIVLCCLGPFLA